MIPTIFDIPENVSDREKLIILFMPQVEVLVNRDFEKFLLLCYRIDLSEDKLKKILRDSPSENLIRELATAIVDRQLLKAEIKKKYGSKGNSFIS